MGVDSVDTQGEQTTDAQALATSSDAGTDTVGTRSHKDTKEVDSVDTQGEQTCAQAAATSSDAGTDTVGTRGHKDTKETKDTKDTGEALVPPRVGAGSAGTDGMVEEKEIAY